MTGRGRLAKNTPMPVRLERYTDRSGECWIWIGAIDKRSGYGRMEVGGKCGYAHRVSYETYVGPIPEGMEIDHLCRVTACCNPAHLEAVTPRINVLRGESSGARARRRDTCFHGMHLYAEHGFFYAGRRACRECNRIYARLWRQVPYAEAMRRKSAGLPVVDLAAYFAQEVAA